MFGHEAHCDVQEDLLDGRSSQRGLQQGHHDLEDSRELPGDLRWFLYQGGFQQTHRALQLHLQLVTTSKQQINMVKLRISGAQYYTFHFGDFIPLEVSCE